jgi:hypothetical protein
VLTVTERLRALGVVGKFAEYFGEGLAALPVADRASIANMAPEYGATCRFFPVDGETLRYVRLTGRSEDHVRLVEVYRKTQGLFHDVDRVPTYRRSWIWTFRRSSPASPDHGGHRIGCHSATSDFGGSLAGMSSRARRPAGRTRRRPVLYQATHSRVANSTSSTLRRESQASSARIGRHRSREPAFGSFLSTMNQKNGAFITCPARLGAPPLLRIFGDRDQPDRPIVITRIGRS